MRTLLAIVETACLIAAVLMFARISWILAGAAILLALSIHIEIGLREVDQTRRLRRWIDQVLGVIGA